MKTIVAFLFVASLSVAANSQNKYTFEFEAQCGSPAVESQIYNRRQGRVIKVVDGDTVQIRDKRQNIWTVELAGADSSQNQERATQILTEQLLNKSVDFIGNPDKEKGNLIEAIVIRKNVEINRLLVENGHSDYRGTDYGYAVSNYTLCTYDKLVEHAKAAKLGIWASK